MVCDSDKRERRGESSNEYLLIRIHEVNVRPPPLGGKGLPPSPIPLDIRVNEEGVVWTLESYSNEMLCVCAWGRGGGV